MDEHPDALEGNFFRWLLQQAGAVPHKLTALKPDFLVIAPPKTGSTWLAENLRHHPAVFIPAIKEVKYFSCFLKSLDLNWYLDQFAEAGGRLKGEVSPSYALLPTWRIRLVHRLFPDLKLVFLMREPVSRAWSHARHTFRYREANFTACHIPFEDLTDNHWAANLVHDWTLASGDYLGQLRRWLSIFPREQVYIGFYESIAREPEPLFRAILAFLGVDAGVDLTAFPLSERIHPGLPGQLPAHTAQFAQRLLHPRSCELVSYLREELGLEPPPEWGAVLCPPEGSVGAVKGPAPEAFRRAAEDDYLSGVLAYEEQFSSAHRVLVPDYRGYWIVCHRGRVFALARAAGSLEEPGEADVRRAQEEGSGFVTLSLAELKEQVDQQVFKEAERAHASLAEREARLTQRIEEALSNLRRLEGEVARLGPGYSPGFRRLRLAWHRLRGFLRRAFLPTRPSRSRAP